MSIQKRKLIPTKPFNDDLPVSQTQSSPADTIGIRRRIAASFSVRIQPLSSSSAAAWAFRRPKSFPGGGPLRRWWEWGLGWILSRKPAFTRDLEMNEEEMRMLGAHSKGTWCHVFHRVRAEIRRLVGPKSTLPITERFRYDSFSYAQNFDDGKS